MKKIVLILLLLLLALPVQAQETNEEFDSLLYSVDGEYRRVEELPVRVCHEETSPEWVAAIDHSLEEIGKVVPYSLSYKRDHRVCDVVIYIVERMPIECSEYAYAGCTTWPNGGKPWPRRVYIYRYVYAEVRISSLLHELMHAYGVDFHPVNRSDVIIASPTPALTTPALTTLTEFDVALLSYLYSRPLYRWSEK